MDMFYTNRLLEKTNMINLKIFSLPNFKFDKYITLQPKIFFEHKNLKY